MDLIKNDKNCHFLKWEKEELIYRRINMFYSFNDIQH